MSAARRGPRPPRGGRRAWAWAALAALAVLAGTVVVVTARSGAGTVTPPVATWTTIAGVQSPASGGEARLVTGLGLLKPEDAIRIA